MKTTFLVTLMLFASTAAFAQSAPDKEAIEAIVAGQTAAWNAHDAKAFAAHFAPDGSFTNIVGMSTYGLAPFQKQHERIFAGIYKNSTASFIIDRIKMVRPDVALIDVNATVTGYSELPPGVQPGADGALHTRLQMLFVKDQGSWMIASFHNVVIAPLPPRP